MTRSGLADSPFFSHLVNPVKEKSTEVGLSDLFPGIQDINLDVIRKTVKQFGKEPTTHRLTPDEKKALLKLVFDYKNQGIRTSENEIVRIAINYILQDYVIYKKESILDRLIHTLND
jgi:hypothetical protein